MAASIPVTDYESALAFLYGRINFERRPPTDGSPRSLNLRRMRRLLRRLGDPQRQLKVVHVAGTKGKGSTASMISSILSQAGYRTGLYTSPHLERLEERIAIDGQSVTSEGLVELVQEVRPAVLEMDCEGPGGGLTFFEVTTAMAMLCFLRERLDITVLEVGLGGRLDSTNVCHPEVAVITSISFDHMRQLGNTLSAIAFEKAGIIKRGIPVVSGAMEDEPSQVIERVARQRGSRLFQLGRDFTFAYSAPNPFGPLEGEFGSICYAEGTGAEARVRERLRLGLLGPHQAANAAVALAAVGRLQEAGWSIPSEAVELGLTRVRCPARIEIVGRRPTVIVDTAHNAASIDALVRTLQESLPGGPRVLIFASSGDKDAAAMLRRLLPAFDRVILTRFLNNPRATDPRRLAEVVDQIAASQSNGAPPPAVSVCPTPMDAWRECQCLVSPEHLVCVTGSFFLAAEMRSLASAAARGGERWAFPGQAVNCEQPTTSNEQPRRD